MICIGPAATIDGKPSPRAGKAIVLTHAFTNGGPRHSAPEIMAACLRSRPVPIRPAACRPPAPTMLTAECRLYRCHGRITSMPQSESRRPPKGLVCVQQSKSVSLPVCIHPGMSRRGRTHASVEGFALSKRAFCTSHVRHAKAAFPGCRARWGGPASRRRCDAPENPGTAVLAPGHDADIITPFGLVRTWEQDQGL